MKYAILVMFAMVALSCKKKNYYYTCFCNEKGGNGFTESLNIGKTTNEDAYARCRAFRDTSKYTCIMQIIK
jgi:hypothetical protein